MRARIASAFAAAGKTAEPVAVVAVTKGFGAGAIEAAIAAGLLDIGENYFQEARDKFAQVSWPSQPVRRHFIGRLQANKARRIASLFDMVQTIDDAEGARLLDAGAAEAGKTIDALVQVNAAGDSRAGIAPSDCLSFVRSLASLRHVRFRGVMAVGPRDPADTRVAFARAARAYDALRNELGADTFSLGMSGDLEAAIAAGSTMVRIGSALFGARPAKV